MSKTVLMVLFAVLVAQPAAAADPNQKIRARMAKLFPDDEVTSVEPTTLAGVYEVMLGATVLYVSADGRYLMRGDLIDLDQRTNLTDQRKAQARERVFAGLDAGSYIEFAQAVPVKQTLYVFTDIDCAYCRKMHTEVAALNAAGIRVRYLAFPRSGLRGESFDKAVAVWCSPDRQAAITAAKSGVEVKAPQCENPVAAQFELGHTLGISGTPAVYTEHGDELGGYIPAGELIKMVKEGRI
jgi:thiol:disulfide interchange protein DsbC